MNPSSRGLAVAIALLGIVGSSAAQEEEGDPAAVTEPTREEIREAYRTRIETLNTRAVDVLGADDAPAVKLTLEDLQKLRCDALDRPGIEYDCRAEVRTRIADHAPVTRLVNLWLVREEDHWVLR